MLSAHTTPEESNNVTITGYCIGENSGRESRDYRDVIVFERAVLKKFSIHTKIKSQLAISISPV